MPVAFWWYWSGNFFPLSTQSGVATVAVQMASKLSEESESRIQSAHCAANADARGSSSIVITSCPGKKPKEEAKDQKGKMSTKPTSLCKTDHLPA
jgi:hypothetical protein